MIFLQIAEESVSASMTQLLGAGGFGAIIGWYVYYINRYRSGTVSWSDLTTLIGIIGGGAIIALFPARTDLFGAYGIGLFSGFFGYYIVLLVIVGMSKNFGVDWFLDGRRRKLGAGEFIPEVLEDKFNAQPAMFTLDRSEDEDNID